jgi:hypothetical protein
VAQHQGAEAMARASVLMQDINEAYAVLSKATTRLEYDARFAAVQSGAVVETPEPAAETPSAAPAAAPMPAAPRVRARPASEVLSSVVGVFSNQLRKDLESKAEGFSWKEKKYEGFDWVLVANFLTTQYQVGVRGFAWADLEVAKKFTNYCNLALSHKHVFKQDYFLFFLLFQKVSQVDTIAAFCRRFCANEEGQREAGELMIALVDVNRGSSLLCGPRIDDPRYTTLLQRLRLARAAGSAKN